MAMRVIIIAVSILTLILGGCSGPAPAATSQPDTTQETASTAPRIVVSPQSITVEFTEGQTKTETRTLTILNDGGGVMLWAATKSQPWIWMTDANGALEKGFSKNLEINIAASGMAAGTYKDVISVEGVGASNSPLSVPVTMVVKAAPAPATESGPAVTKKAAPPPPWEYNEWTNDTYNLRFRYPKTYTVRQLAGMPFGAINNPGKDDSDMIMIMIESAYGVSYLEAITEFSKEAMRQMGAGRMNPKVIANDNMTTLADGITPAYEVTIESRSSSGGSYECYVFGFKKGNRYIFFAGVSLIDYAPNKLDIWKQMGKTLEITD